MRMFSNKNKVFLSISAMLFVLFFAWGCQHTENTEENDNNNDVMEESLNMDMDSDQEEASENDVMEEVVEILTKEPEEEQAPQIVMEDLEWKNYSNNLLSYSFEYPTILDVRGDDLDQHLELTGPLYQNEWWPRIEISHYSSSFYRPTGEDVSVEEWVKAFPEYELGESRTIAGLEALHYVQDKTPQAWAADYFYFIKDNQLYKITIIHGNDRQDWELYNRILDSFSFTEDTEL